MTHIKVARPILLLLTMLFMVMGCANKEDKAFLEKVKGTGFAYSEYFKSVDEQDNRKKVTYYTPLPIDELVSVVPSSIKNAVHLIDPQKLPFEVSEQTAYVVTSEDEKGNIQNQVQLTYIHSDEYDQTEAFYIITVTELKENPLDKYDFSKQQTDTIGNELRKEILIDDLPIFHQVITTESALAYRYYSYDEKKKQVSTVVTSANELYSYYNGYLYHLGYVTENKNTKAVQEEILQLTREFILGT